MLTICETSELTRLLDRVVKKPDRVRSVAIASAFVDVAGLDWLNALDSASPGFPIHVATRPESAGALYDRGWRNTKVSVVRGLHAKAYAVVGVLECESEAVVGSWNLTRAGLSVNIEFGVRVTASTQYYATLIRRMERWIRNVHRHPHIVHGRH